jgi:DNA-binding beta-propeller fold protein YncE
VNDWHYGMRHENSPRVLVSVVGVLLLGWLWSGNLQADGFQYPLAVGVDSNRTIYVVDRDLPGIWKVQDGKPAIYFQGSKKFRTPLNAVRCLAFDSKGVLYAGDSSTREVYRFDEPGKPVPLTKGEIGIPMALAFDSVGNLFVADTERHVIFKIAKADGAVTQWAKVQGPRGIAVDSKDRVLVISNSKQPLVRFGADAKQEVVIREPIFQFINQMVLDGSDNAYICDGYAKTIWKAAPDGKTEKVFSGEPLKHPVGIALDKDQLIIADPHLKQIFSLPMEGEKKLKLISQ